VHSNSCPSSEPEPESESEPEPISEQTECSGQTFSTSHGDGLVVVVTFVDDTVKVGDDDDDDGDVATEIGVSQIDPLYPSGHKQLPLSKSMVEENDVVHDVDDMVVDSNGSELVTIGVGRKVIVTIGVGRAVVTTGVGSIGVRIALGIGMVFFVVSVSRIVGSSGVKMADGNGVDITTSMQVPPLRHRHEVSELLLVPAEVEDDEVIKPVLLVVVDTMADVVVSVILTVVVGIEVVVGSSGDLCKQSVSDRSGSVPQHPYAFAISAHR